MLEQETQSWSPDDIMTHVQTISNSIDAAANGVSLSEQESSHSELASPHLETLPGQMLEAVSSNRGKDEALSALLKAVTNAVNLTNVFLFERDENGQLTGSPTISKGAQLLLLEESNAARKLACKATESGKIQFGDDTRGRVAVPIYLPGRSPDSIGAVLNRNDGYSLEQVGQILQLAATHISLWHVLHTSIQAEEFAANMTAILESCLGTKHSDSVESICLSLAADLQTYVGCEHVAIGICSSNRQSCQLKAVSGFSHFDKHGEVADAIESALNESLILEKTVIYDPQCGVGETRCDAVQHLQTLLGAGSIIAAPLKDREKRPIGAWLFVTPVDTPGTPAVEEFIRNASPATGLFLDLMQHGAPNRLSRFVRRVPVFQTRMKAIATAAVIGLTTALLCIPFPHKVDCDCKVQPVVRRFVAAPYDGILKETLVEPGDDVTEGQILAEMDGREIHLRIIGLKAEYQRERKNWEASLSADDIAAAQQANLEMKQLDMKIQLLTDRQRNLQIRSPLSGTVVSGDIEKSEGAPLKMGQSLFEIAPTDRMAIEIDIPQDEIAYATEGMDMLVHLDAHPRNPYTAAIESIVPRAQIRDDRTVFLAKTELENVVKELRPGMSGQATLQGEPRPLAWLLFHKPYESILMMLGW